MKRYSKAIVAFLGAAATWAATSLDDNGITHAEWAGLAAALLGVFAVFQVRNEPAEGGDEGSAGIGLLGVLLIVLIAVLLLR